MVIWRGDSETRARPSCPHWDLVEGPLSQHEDGPWESTLRSRWQCVSLRQIRSPGSTGVLQNKENYAISTKASEVIVNILPPDQLAKISLNWPVMNPILLLRQIRIRGQKQETVLKSI